MPPGEGSTPFADDRFIPIFQLDDELVGIRRPGSRHNLLPACLRFSVGNILADGSAEEDRVLQNDPDLPAQRLASKPPDVGPVDENRPFLGFVEAQDQAHDGGFARARNSHQRQPLARRHGKRNLLQHIAAVPVIKGNPVEDDLTLQTGRDNGVWRVLDFRFDIEHLGDSFRAGHCFREIGGQLGQAANRFVHVGQVRDDQNEFTGHHPAMHDLKRSEKHGRRRSGGGNHFRRAGRGGLQTGDADAFLQRLRRRGIESFLFVFFAGKSLHQRNR